MELAPSTLGASTSGVVGRDPGPPAPTSCPTLLTTTSNAKLAHELDNAKPDLDLELAIPQVCLATKDTEVEVDKQKSQVDKPISCLQTFLNTWTIARYYFGDRKARCKAWAMTISLCVMVVIQTLLTIWLAELIKEITEALVWRREKEFHASLTRIVVMIGIAVPLSCVEEWLCGALALEWRRHTTRWLLERYIDPAQSYYHMKMQSCCDVDNPDQRIGQDVSEFTTSIVKLQKTLVSSALQIMVASGVLFAISEDLFLWLVCVSTLGTSIFLKVFGGRLMVLTRLVLKHEASFRFSLIRVRENAEPIAFYQGSGFEMNCCLAYFANVMRAQYRKLRVWSIFLGGQRAMYGYATLFPTLILGPQILKGEVPFATISQANLLFGVLLGSLTSLLTDLGTIASVGAQAIRIKHLMEVLDHLHHGRQADGGYSDSSIKLSEREGDDVCLELQQIVLQPPQSKSPLMPQLSLVLRRGQSLLISGESGIGKSSLLRAVGGLWTAGQGTISRCKASSCFFVPQAPYLCLGSLRDNAIYPFIDSVEKDASRASTGKASISDSEVEEALRAVNLGHLISRHGLHADVSFESVLSGGEKQRLGFARVLLRPGLEIALLDEATSALDPENEDAMYDLLTKRARCHASVAHSANLEKFHTHNVQLQRHAIIWRKGDVQLAGQQYMT